MTEEKTTLTDEQIQAIIKEFVEAKQKQILENNNIIKNLAAPLIKAAIFMNDKNEAYFDKEYFVIIMQKILTDSLPYYQVVLNVKELPY